MAHPSRRALVAACAGLTLGGGGGGARAAGEQAKPKPPPAPAPTICGALLPLSGDQALVGDECRRGIQLAIDAVNRAGGIAGHPAGLATGDAFDQDHAPAAAQYLINNGHAAFILGSGASALSYPGSAAAELAQIPYIELNAPADGIMNRGFKYLLRSTFTTTAIAELLIGAINQRFPNKKIGLIFNTGATAGAIAAAALTSWQKTNTPPLISIAYPSDTAALHGPVSRLKRAGAEVLLHAADPNDALIFYAALQSASWKPTAIFGAGDGYLLRETAFTLGPGFDGTIVAGAPFYPPRAAYIAAAYQARYSMPPRSADSLTAYVGAKLVLDKLNEVKGDTTKLLDALRKTSLPAGTLANNWGVSFDKTGQNTASFPVLQEWHGQALTPLR